METSTKRCARCKAEKPSSGFYRSSKSPDGLQGYCKDCVREYGSAYRVVLPDRSCEVCGKAFSPKTSKRRFCSANCKETARYRRNNPKTDKACQACGKPIDHRRRDAKWCSDACSLKGRVTPARRRAQRLRLYGLSEEDYELLLNSQAGVCAICGTSDIRGFGKRLAVDHCHDSGRVRGILCGNCNRGIGAFHDDPALLLAAAAYLRRFPKPT